jgi:hypothetical protein
MTYSLLKIRNELVFYALFELAYANTNHHALGMRLLGMAITRIAIKRFDRISY